jgi:cytochrome c oxidase subunit 1
VPQQRALDRLLSTDHKRVGLLFLGTSLFFLVVGGVTAGLLRADTAMPDSSLGEGGVFAQLYSLHGVTSVFLFLMPAWIGLGLYVVPLQVGARSVAFPRVAALSFWLYLVGGVILAASYLVDDSAASGMPVPERLVEAGDGADLMILGLAGVSVAFVLAAVVLVTTIARMRAPGMTMWRVPAFSWSMLATGALLLLATPVAVAGLALLYLSVHHGGLIFDPRDGDYMVLWQHLLWFYGRPDVWALALPAFGVVSEVVPVFGRRPLPDHRALVAAFGIAVPFAFGTWAYEVKDLSAKPLLPFFSWPAALILVPLGIVVLLWLGTLARARPSFDSAPLFALGMLLTLALSAPLAIAAVLASDVALEQTQFVAANAHLFLFVPATFGVFAGLFYWAPKMAGRHLSEGLGKVQVGLMLLEIGRAHV